MVYWDRLRNLEECIFFPANYKWDRGCFRLLGGVIFVSWINIILKLCRLQSCCKFSLAQPQTCSYFDFTLLNFFNLHSQEIFPFLFLQVWCRHRVVESGYCLNCKSSLFLVFLSPLTLLAAGLRMIPFCQINDMPLPTACIHLTYFRFYIRVFRKHIRFAWRIILVKLIIRASSVSLCWLQAAWFEKHN